MSIAKQSLTYTLIGYLGFLIGTLAALFLFPQDMEFYGKLRFILPTAEMMAPFVVFGISFTGVKFFSNFESAGKTNSLLTVSLLLVLVNFLLFLGFFSVFFKIFPEKKSLEIWRYRYTIIPLILLIALSQIFNKFLTNFKRIAVSNIFDSIFPKLANIGAFCLFFFAGLSEQFALSFFVTVFFSALMGYGLYTRRIHGIRPDFSLEVFRKNRLYRAMFSYSLFGFLGNIGNYIAFRIDNYMIGEHISMVQNGVYSTLLNIMSLIMIPQMGIHNISAPIINKSLENRDMEELDRFYKGTSLSLFFLGVVLFSCILSGFPYLTHFIKNGDQLREAEPVIWLLGSAMLFDLATGFNGHIISLSRYYRLNIVVMLLLAATTILLNYLFIRHTKLGIIGVALATAISLTVFNIVKVCFNYVKFRVLPFTMEMGFLLIVSGLAITLVILLPNFQNPLINLFYKPAVSLAFILTGNYFLQIFPLKQYLKQTFLGKFLP